MNTRVRCTFWGVSNRVPCTTEPRALCRFTIGKSVASIANKYSYNRLKHRISGVSRLYRVPFDIPNLCTMHKEGGRR